MNGPFCFPKILGVQKYNLFAYFQNRRELFAKKRGFINCKTASDFGAAKKDKFFVIYNRGL